jgi:hypothetical protein
VGMRQCCATVDTTFVTLRGTGIRTRTSARLTCLLVTPSLSYPSERRLYRGALSTRPDARCGWVVLKRQTDRSS